ncbi:MAG: hypothetical protein EBX35_01080 [Planctomycetia bacterium]|nr:hypothetical protein [Planctomycetia bacterium]
MTGTGNPFNNGIVADAWSRPVVNVPGIGREVFELLLASLADVRAQRKRRSILIHGAPGSGKTHLLARLRAAVAAETAEPPPFFCYVRLATTPSMMHRHLRASLVRDLLRKDERGITALESSLLTSLAKETGQPSEPAQAAARLERLRGDAVGWDELREAYGEVCVRLGLDYSLARAGRLFLLHQHRAEVSHWLKSGDLPDTLREALGFDGLAGRPEADGQERAAAEMVHQLARLVVDTRPLVLCFDQIESLQLSPDDRTGFFAFGRLAADLVDQIESILLITCVQSGLWPLVRQAITAADFHRLAQEERLLKPITADEAAALIRGRLDASPALRHDPRRDADPLWPIGADGLRTFLAEGDCTPRRLIAVCREAFPHAFGEPPAIAAILSDLFERRRLDALTTLDDTTETFVHGLAIMVAARLRVPVTTSPARPDVDLVISLPGRQVGISICNQEGGALASHLKHMSQHPLGLREERILVRDMRLPIPHTYRRAWEHWERLVTGREATAEGIPRIRAVCPSPELLASLEAVRSVSSDAHAGELECRGRTIPPHVVEAWIRSDLRDEQLDGLLAEIEHGPARRATSGEPARTPLRDAVLEQLQRRHLMRVEEIAQATAATPEEIRRLTAAGEPVFGTLGDPVVLVYERFGR